MSNFILHDMDIACFLARTRGNKCRRSGRKPSGGVRLACGIVPSLSGCTPCEKSARNDTSERIPSVHLAKGSVESTHEVPTSHYHTFETLPRSGRVARWTNTPARIFKDPAPTPVPATLHHRPPALAALSRVLAPKPKWV